MILRKVALVFVFVFILALIIAVAVFGTVMAMDFINSNNPFIAVTIITILCFSQSFLAYKPAYEWVIDQWNKTEHP